MSMKRQGGAADGGNDAAGSVGWHGGERSSSLQGFKF
jgi:hypothetical protein